MKTILCFVGTTENAGRENDGPSKSRGMKMQDMNMQDMKMQDFKMLYTKIDGLEQLLACSENYRVLIRNVVISCSTLCWF